MTDGSLNLKDHKINLMVKALNKTLTPKGASRHLGISEKCLKQSIHKYNIKNQNGLWIR